MIVLILFVLALAKSSLFSHFGFGLVDEGQSLQTTLKLLSGKLPYRDFFAVFPPLHYYLYALPSLAFGPSIIWPRLLNSLIFSLTPPLLFILNRQHVSTKYALIPAILLIFLNPNIDRFYFLSFIFAALYLAQIKRYYFWSGLVFGLSCWFRLDISLAIFGSFCLFNLRHIPKLIGGFTVPVVALLIFLLANHLLPAFVDNAVVQAVAITRKHDLPIPTPTNLQLTYLTYVFGLVIAVYLFSLIYLKRNYFRLHLGFWIMSGVFMLPYMLGRTDMGHLTKGGLPFFILGPYFLQRLKAKPIAALVVIGLFAGCLVESVAWLRLHNNSVVVGRDHLRLPYTNVPGTTYPSANTVASATAFLRTSKSGQVAALPYMAGLYYLARLPSVTRYDNVLYGYLPDQAAEQAFINKITQVDRVVYDPVGGPKTRITSFADFNPTVHAYLVTNYTIINTTPEGWQFMVKND